MSASAPSQTVFSIGYDFHLGSANNGNVYGITNYKDANRNQTFTYDALNRLISAQNAGTDCNARVLQNKTEYWGNNYGYDAWGNLLQKNVTKCGAENLQVTADSHNWLHTLSAPDYQYDAAGNMTSDPTDGVSLTYDPENRLTGAGGFTYTYDADGNRVKKSSGSTGTLYWYMTPGIVAESDLNGVTQSEYVFFAGERVARRDFPAGSVAYYFSDHLKTASVITDSLGNIKSESDFYPWGGELQLIANDSNHYKFTGKERDTETGLDYFGARYYSSGLGRFVSADWSATPVPVPYADLSDPQSLDLNTYVRNLPTTRTDPDGHQTTVAEQNIERDIRDLAAGRITKAEFDSRARARALGGGVGLGIVLGVVYAPAGAALARNVLGVGMAAASTPAGQHLLNETAEAISNPLPTVGPSSASVWKLAPIARGIAIENKLAATEYQTWFRIGAENGGKFPLFDFQKGNTLVSLKSVDTAGTSWLKNMRAHIDAMFNSGATVGGKAANMVLDLRVQPGGAQAAQELAEYGKKVGIKVTVTEFH